MQETSGSSCLLPPPLLPLNTHIRYVSTQPGSFFRERKLQFGGDGRSFPAADSCGYHARRRCKLVNISPTHTTSLMLASVGRLFLHSHTSLSLHQRCVIGSDGGSSDNKASPSRASHLLITAVLSFCFL